MSVYTNCCVFLSFKNIYHVQIGKIKKPDYSDSQEDNAKITLTIIQKKSFRFLFFVKINNSLFMSMACKFTVITAQKNGRAEFF